MISALAGNRSFRLCGRRFYNEMFATVQSYISDNYDNLDLRLYRVQNIGGIELSDVEVKFVSVNDLPDMKIEFDVAIEAGFESESQIITMMNQKIAGNGLCWNAQEI